MPSEHVKELKKAIDALVARSRALADEHERVTAEYNRLLQELRAEEREEAGHPREGERKAARSIHARPSD